MASPARAMAEVAGELAAKATANATNPTPPTIDARPSRVTHTGLTDRSGAGGFASESPKYVMP